MIWDEFRLRFSRSAFRDPRITDELGNLLCGLQWAYIGLLKGTNNHLLSQGYLYDPHEHHLGGVLRNPLTHKKGKA